jgi:2-polyprenyl-3-methyl-5-hydroxy-6-metoxy-1,4-benzoquinol methylase
MKSKAKGLFQRLTYRLTDRFPDEKFVLFIYQLIQRRVNNSLPSRALKILFSLDAMLYEIQGEQAVLYDGGVHTKHRHMKYHDFFVNRITNQDRVMDIGCGIGAVASDVAQVAKHVVGMDFNVTSIKTARERFHRDNLEFRMGDALETLPEEKFNVVILSNVLEHLPDRSHFLHRVQKTLQPNRILIRVPVFERDWRVPLKKELGVEWRLDPTHETEYTLETFAEEMKEAGLTIRHLEVRWGEIWAEVANQ